MIHHPGEVLEIFRPTDSDIKSADNDTLAALRMWDENLMILVVDQKIASDISVGDKVLVDYRPVEIPKDTNAPIVARQFVSKIIKGKRAEAVWKEYKKFFEKQKRRQTQTVAPRPQESYIG